MKSCKLIIMYIHTYNTQSHTGYSQSISYRLFTIFKPLYQVQTYCKMNTLNILLTLLKVCITSFELLHQITQLNFMTTHSPDVYCVLVAPPEGATTVMQSTSRSHSYIFYGVQYLHNPKYELFKRV